MPDCFIIHIIFIPIYLGALHFNWALPKTVTQNLVDAEEQMGKKWRCSKDAFPDSKYCERHMHRGRNRSRKPVETPASHSSSLSLSTASARNNSIPSITNNTQSHVPFATPYSTSRLAGAGIVPPPSSANSNSSSNNQFNTDVGSYSIPSKDYRYMKGDIDEHVFFSTEVSGTSRGLGIDSQSMLSSSVDSGWRSLMPSKVSPFSSQSSFPTDAATKQQHSFLTSSFGGVQDQPVNVKIEQQPLRHFFDEWPRSRDSSTLSWTELDEDRSNRSSSTTQLSISIPITSSDFSGSSNSRSPTRGCK